VEPSRIAFPRTASSRSPIRSHNAFLWSLFFLFLFFNLNSCAFAVCFRQLFPWFSCLLQLTVQPKDYASTGLRLCRPLLSAAGSGDARGILNTRSPEAAVPAVPSGTALTAQEPVACFPVSQRGAETRGRTHEEVAKGTGRSARRRALSRH